MFTRLGRLFDAAFSQDDGTELGELRDRCVTLTQANVRLVSQNSRLRTDRDDALYRAETAEAEAARLLAESERLRCELAWEVSR